ncbi:hypothetical protein RZS08_24495, partial [Arthrospira platensis SPKY1]|nr:hypothetical protein [Arthrospira platensis SPKY1]
MLAFELETTGPVVEVRATSLSPYGYVELPSGEWLPVLESPRSFMMFEAAEVESSVWDRLE